MKEKLNMVQTGTKCAPFNTTFENTTLKQTTNSLLKLRQLSSYNFDVSINDDMYMFCTSLYHV